jgi:RsiW-degrading membrane proteinase PrsW (M82 family)
MSLSAALTDLVLLWIAALVPALLYLSWVRKTERYMTEAWGTLLRSFLYGALFATIVAAVIELILVSVGTAISHAVPGPDFTFLNGNSSLGELFLVLVIAPFVEEALKASGVVSKSSALRMVSDGPVFGASVGLGFGFFETFLYGLTLFLTSGLVAALGLVVVRSLSSVLLHGSSTGMFGYGYASSKLSGRGSGAGLYYLVAVAMHATFNIFASSGVLVQYFGLGAYAGYADVVGLVLAILFAFSAIEHVRRLIRETNYPMASGIRASYAPAPPRTAGIGPPHRPS